MIKKLMAVLALTVVMGLTSMKVNAQETTTVYFSYSGNSGPNYQHCLTVTMTNGKVAPTGYYYCPNQPSSFSQVNNYHIGSLYLPPPDIDDYYIIMEGLTITVGAIVPLTYNTDGTVATFQRTDTFSGYGWAGSTITEFTNMKVRVCNRTCFNTIQAWPTGGSGSINNPNAD